jgi:soluble lytic murein transglycosylase
MLVLSVLLAGCRTAAAAAQSNAVPAVPSMPVAMSAPAAVSATPPVSAPSPVGLEFMAAMQRIRQRVPEPADSPALEAYAIHDYLVAARLRRDLSTGAGGELDHTVDAFLQSHAGQPVARALRHDWLVSLADRKRWDWFLPRSTDVVDAQIACDRLAGRLASGDTAVLGRDALARWALPQKQPDECNAVFAWLRTQGMVTPELAETRTRAALAADNPRLARDFVVDVPPPRSAPLMQWIQLLDTPNAAIAMLAATSAAPVEPDALVAGFSRLSVSDTNAATGLLPALLQRPDLSPAVRVRLQRAAALGAAYSRAPGAVAAFAALPEDAGDGQVQEWRVRAALWTGDFAQVSRWIEGMSPGLAALPRWRYWHARAVAATAGAATAAPLYADIAGMRDYYGYLAADRLDQPYNLNIKPSPDDADAQATLAAEPGLIRAHALFDCDQTDDAGAEWAAVVGAAKPALKVQAAHLASRWGWYAQTIATLAQAGEWDDVRLRYPRPYPAIVADASKETGVPCDWLYAIMRQESLFRRDAVSRADARGLMQMQPATATAVARRWNLPAPARDSLFDPSIAVKLGALYAHELLDRYKGQLDQALAAYNAGPMPVARWMPGRTLDADIWIENIPYTETRGYVQHIVEHIVAFAKMRDGEVPRLSVLLPPVESPIAAGP